MNQSSIVAVFFPSLLNLTYLVSAPREAELQPNLLAVSVSVKVGSVVVIINPSPPLPHQHILPWWFRALLRFLTQLGTMARVVTLGIIYISYSTQLSLPSPQVFDYPNTGAVLSSLRTSEVTCREEGEEVQPPPGQRNIIPTSPPLTPAAGLETVALAYMGSFPALPIFPEEDPAVTEDYSKELTGSGEQQQHLHSGLTKFLQVKLKDLKSAATLITFVHLCRMCLPLLTSSLMLRNSVLVVKPLPRTRLAQSSKVLHSELTSQDLDTVYNLFLIT